MPKDYVFVDWDDADSGCLNDDRVDQVLGVILDQIMPPAWSQEEFGIDYANRFFPKKEMSFYIKLLFDQPCVDLGIVFDDFAIADDAISADENNELLSVIENLSDRRAFYAEINIEEDEQHPWYDIEIDDRYLARFIPLLKVDDQTTLFHAPHLYQLLDYLFSIEGVAPFFAVPRGPSAKLLHLARY